MVVAQTAALNARQTALQNPASPLAATVDLISALAGGWTTAQGVK